MWNNLKTTILLAALTGLLLGIGQMTGGERGLVFALTLAVILNFASYFFSDKIAIAMSGAKAVPRESAPRLYDVVERLAVKANIPVPKIYLIPSEAPNAFATGRNPRNASVAVTQGLLERLSDEEVEGVLAHELAHVKNRDILTSAVVATLAGAITMIARMAYYAELFGFGGGRSDDRRGGALSALLMMIVAPLVAVLIQLAISRSREFQADATGAEITGNPYGLARALQKIEGWSKRLPMDVSPAMSHMFICQPLTTGEVFSKLFSTHPPIRERIRRLIGQDMI